MKLRPLRHLWLNGLRPTSRPDHCSLTLLAHRGLARLFKMWGSKGGPGVSRGDNWDSKWQLSIDLCTKCNFIWGQEGAEFLPGGRLLPCPSPSGYATVAQPSARADNGVGRAATVLLDLAGVLYTWTSLTCGRAAVGRGAVRYRFWVTNGVTVTSAGFKSIDNTYGGTAPPTKN